MDSTQKATARSKKLAVFLDGTWNTSLSNTNVWRLKSLCSQNESQRIYYCKGVGTNFGEKVSGGMLGIGIDVEITDAYEWLIENFNDGDQLFIFGFSRGAYTARSLAGLISKFGLLKLGAPMGVGQLYSKYKAQPNSRSIRTLQKNPNDPSYAQDERWLAKYSRPIPIRFLGIWDTVGSLGVPWTKAPFFNSKEYRFHETDLHINQDYAFHAIAIDEHRKSFAPTLWTATRNKSGDNFAARTLEHVEQRWFVGAHANVGGGYESDALAQLPLKWIMDKAVLHGLEFFEALEVDADAESDSVADSYADFLWGYGKWFWPRYYRAMGAEPIDQGAKVTATINESIDGSVFRRWKSDPKYRPPSLAKWAKRKNVDPAQIGNSILANDPSKVIV